MDSKLIQKRVDDLSKAMIGKGMREPSARLTFRSDEKATIFLSWKKGRNTGDIFGNEKHHVCTGEVSKILDDAIEFIAKQPDAATAKLQDFMAALGSVIDIGRKNGIETDFLNPLVATMKRLSENAITHQAA